MEITLYSLLVILGSGLVTWLPRILPFILIRKLNLPHTVIRFLSYVPICILTALFTQSLLIQKESAFPIINIEYLLASIPAVITIILTRSLLWVVIVGIASMGFIRLLL